LGNLDADTNGWFAPVRATSARGVHVMTFETAVPDYRCLNNVLAIGEGFIDVQRASLMMR
jgi:hypothetical protein